MKTAVGKAFVKEQSDYMQIEVERMQLAAEELNDPNLHDVHETIKSYRFAKGRYYEAQELINAVVAMEALLE